MKLFYVLLTAFVVGGTSLFYQSGLGAAKSSPPLKPAAVQASPRRISLGVGTVLISHFYPLIPPRRVPLRYIFVTANQHVRKGEVLAKFEDHTFVVARAAGIITLPAPGHATPATDAFPRLWFTETAPFRLRLPLTAANVSLCPGQQVRVSNRAHPTQLVTGTVSKVVFDNLSLLIDLRLQSVGPSPLPASTPVLVEAFLPQVV